MASNSSEASQTMIEPRLPNAEAQLCAVVGANLGDLPSAVQVASVDGVDEPSPGVGPEVAQRPTKTLAATQPPRLLRRAPERYMDGERQVRIDGRGTICKHDAALEIACRQFQPL